MIRDEQREHLESGHFGFQSATQRGQRQRKKKQECGWAAGDGLCSPRAKGYESCQERNLISEKMPK